MSFASLYFLLKLGLYYTHRLGFHWGLNLLLAFAMFWPIAQQRWRRWRALATGVLALVLLYHDSLLAAPARLLAQLGTLNQFSTAYLQELLGRVFDPLALGLLLAVSLAYHLLSQRVRFPTVALLGILSVPLTSAWDGSLAGSQESPNLGSGAVPGQGAVPASPAEQLRAFYARENQRRVAFSTDPAAAPFDILLLHVCSLSWDDLDFADARNHPLLKRFDVLFTHFNSAASYSGPASLRLLRGNCGQQPQAQLYQGADPQCYVFPSLEKLGYQTSALLNHDGQFDDFLKTLEHQGGLSGKIRSHRGVNAHLHGFDGSAIYDDFALLAQFWRERQSQGAQPVALYYNTVSLHDGNQVPGLASTSSVDTYKPRLLKLMDDLDRFLSQLEASGKPVLVMLVPEHGAAVRGDKLQIAGMREIPGPGITLVPVAMKLVGLRRAQGSSPLIVAQPTSFLGLNALLANLLQDNPFKADAAPLETRLSSVQATPYVAENEDLVVMRGGNGAYLMKGSDGAWMTYPVQ